MNNEIVSLYVAQHKATMVGFFLIGVALHMSRDIGVNRP
jgi:hypothetical protein